MKKPEQCGVPRRNHPALRRHRSHLLMLTGQRREEVAGMTWAELSEDLTTWTIPGTRTKNGMPHIVPLSQPACELLRSPAARQPAEDARHVRGARNWHSSFLASAERLLAAGRKQSHTLDAASGVSGWWLHDLRRTLATGLQRLGVRLEVTEAVLNHLSGSRAGIVGIYQRHDWAEEKRSALDAWSAHLLARCRGRQIDAKVIALTRMS